MPLDTGTWFPTSIAEAFLFTPLRVGFIVLVALLARTVTVRMIRRGVRVAIERPGVPKAGVWAEQLRLLGATSAERRSQRLGALGSLACSIATVVIALIALMIVLAELRFNVTSLIAGSSIIAATLTFGMQNVVKDLLSGVFLLSEDQLGVGDWVMLEGGGEASGQVLEVSLRITRLRLTDGTVIAVRNGELLRITNYSQGGPNQLPDEPEPVDD